MGIIETNASRQAMKKANQLGLRLTSAYRSPAKDKAVGGSGRGDHTKGLAYDFAGDWNSMNTFGKWAKSSGLFRWVGWQVAGHYDHVHVSWVPEGNSKYVDHGDRGEWVEVIQKLVRIKVDGIFGDNTEKAVKDFQEKVGIKEDGIVGPITYNFLTSGIGKLFQ